MTNVKSNASEVNQSTGIMANFFTNNVLSLFDRVYPLKCDRSRGLPCITPLCGVVVYLLMVELNVFKGVLIICNSPFKHAGIGYIFVSFDADATITQFFRWGLSFPAIEPGGILNLQICIESVVRNLTTIFVV